MRYVNEFPYIHNKSQRMLQWIHSFGKTSKELDGIQFQKTHTISRKFEEIWTFPDRFNAFKMQNCNKTVFQISYEMRIFCVDRVLEFSFTLICDKFGVSHLIVIITQCSWMWTQYTMQQLVSDCALLISFALPEKMCMNDISRLLSWKRH